MIDAISTPKNTSPLPSQRSRSAGSVASKVASPAAQRRNDSIAAGGPPAAMPWPTSAAMAAVTAWGSVVPARMGGSCTIAARTAMGWRRVSSRAMLPPALVPTTTAGEWPRAASRAAAASACSASEVCSQPAGRGQRELPRRS
jgi:hypothetical protein